MEAIILAGGNSYRLKPEIWVPKPLLPFGKFTLLEHQILWLMKHNIHDITIASNEIFPISTTSINHIQFSTEDRKLGTGGAVLRAMDFVEGKEVYVMNVDDIVKYNPNELINARERDSILLLSKPKLGFGRVQMRDNMVSRFQEKPHLDFYVSAGHYVFTKKVVADYFPEEGDLEKEVLPSLVEDKKLNGLKLVGEWVTINTYKDYIESKKILGIL